jgi:pullulanase
VFEYIKALIRMRKEHSAFRMRTSEQIASQISFINKLPPGTIAYTINGAAVGDRWNNILVVLNGNSKAQDLPINAPDWKKVFSIAEGFTTGTPGIAGTLQVAAYSCDIYIKK